MTRVALLGSTGSIGTGAQDVLRAHPGRLEAASLTAHRSADALAAACREFRPRHAVLTDDRLRGEVSAADFGGADLLFGADGLETVAADPGVDTVLSAVVGAAGLRGTWAAVEHGKTVALANKETLVVAGPLVTAKARETGSTLLPVDSEHAAIHQCLAAGPRGRVRRVVLTASGGPFRGKKVADLADVTPADALAHPTWDMGERITIDSASMANKALEVIEAKWLFDLRVDQIAVVVHPQSVAHSFVEFEDGSVVAQLSPPDMRLPIQYALLHPDRPPGPARRMDWSEAFALSFEPPDTDAFPALRLGFEVAERGGTCGAVFNAADEVAVARFLAGGIRFPDIARLLADVLGGHDFDPTPTLDALFAADAAARNAARDWKP